MHIRNVEIFNTGETHVNTFKTAKDAEREIDILKSEYKCFKNGVYDRTLSHTGLVITLEQRLKTGDDSDLDGWSAVYIHWSDDKSEILFMETFQTRWGDA